MAARKFVLEKRRRLSKKRRRRRQEKRWNLSWKKSKTMQKKPGEKPSAVQTLFEMCKEIFCDCGPGVLPSAENVNRLSSFLDTMDASNVGLYEEMPYFRHPGHQETPEIKYMLLYQCDKFSICIFCLPPSSVIPLHNHPGMTVFSKLLFGSMHVKSYDWANIHDLPEEFTGPSHFLSPGMRLAKLKTNANFTAPCETSVLYPEDGGNMHCFTARTACAVLDVLGPPYSSSEEGRDCTYYKDFVYDSFPVVRDSNSASTGAYALLEETEQVDDIAIWENYRGPRIVVAR